MIDGHNTVYEGLRRLLIDGHNIVYEGLSVRRLMIDGHTTTLCCAVSSLHAPSAVMCHWQMTAGPALLFWAASVIMVGPSLGAVAPSPPPMASGQIRGPELSAAALQALPQPPTLSFLVVGDFGSGSAGQRAVAAAMQASVTDDHRFVLSTGDNFYPR